MILHVDIITKSRLLKNYVDLSYLYVNLSDKDVEYSDLYIDFTEDFVVMALNGQDLFSNKLISVTSK